MSCRVLLVFLFFLVCLFVGLFFFVLVAVVQRCSFTSPCLACKQTKRRPALGSPGLSCSANVGPRARQRLMTGLTDGNANGLLTNYRAIVFSFSFVLEKKKKEDASANQSVLLLAPFLDSCTCSNTHFLITAPGDVSDTLPRLFKMVFFFFFSPSKKKRK